MKKVSKKIDKYVQLASTMALSNIDKTLSLLPSSKPYEISCFNCGKKVEREKAHLGIYCSKECRQEKLNKMEKKEDK